MERIKNIKWLPVIMGLCILAIACFQLYWLQNTYDREKRTLDMRTNILFRETVRGIQSAKFKLDQITGDSNSKKILFHRETGSKLNGSVQPEQKMIGIVDALIKRQKDSGRKTIIYQGCNNCDSLNFSNKAYSSRRNRIMQFLFDVDSLQDSVRVNEVAATFTKRLNEQNMIIPFKVSRVPAHDTSAPVYNEVTLGFLHPITYRLELGNTFPYTIRRISIPILFSLLLVGFTILSFSLLYSTLLRQRRLADIKNEFISNITHELKTPIATVSVAIEALRSFNASIDAERTKEYLTISANELQRLSLLVDKVLKLSMFEKKEVDLKYEVLDMKDLVHEVTSSMRLQFEKRKASVKTVVEGNTMLEGDRLHLVSVIFNLLDNALKYSSEQPQIIITMREEGDKINLCVQDAGIGIPAEYQGRIFEKFFRVPTGNLHNAKGYGLGLSYVAHVIKKHDGEIHVESTQGDGSKFFISIPKQQSS